MIDSTIDSSFRALIDIAFKRYFEATQRAKETKRILDIA